MDMEEAKKKEIVQMIKVNLGLTVHEAFKSYIIKKYPLDHHLVRLLN